MERGRFNYVLERCRGKKVLHVGCGDEGLTASRLQTGLLLHAKLYRVCRELYGIDISRPALQTLQDAGYENLYRIDIEESIPYLGSFDVIVVPEVLEHLSNPGKALDNLHKVPTKYIIFSVPAMKPFRGEHPDHNFYFTAKSLGVMLRKHSYKIVDIKSYAFSRLAILPDGYLATAIKI